MVMSGNVMERTGLEKEEEENDNHDVRKLSFLPFCQRLERRTEDTKMEHNCDDEKENRWVQTCSFHGKNPYIK